MNSTVAVIVIAFGERRKMVKVRRYPSQEQLDDMLKYREALRARGISNKLLAYMLGYRMSYINAIMAGFDPITIKVREGFNLVIDMVDSLKIKNN